MNKKSQIYFDSGKELDLAELFRCLRQQWIWIVFVTLLFLFAFALYAFLATPWYETRTYLRPIESSALDQLNATKLYELKPDEALARVAGALSSYDNRYEFFLQNQGLFEKVKQEGGSQEQAFSRFNEDAFTMLYPRANETNRTGYVGLSLTYPKGMDGVAIVNQFVKFVLQREQDSIGDDIKSLIKNRLADIDARIAADRANYQATKDSKIARLREGNELRRAQLQDELRALQLEAKAKRESRIAELGEAISIAQALGIHKPTTPSAVANSGRDAGTVVRTEVLNQATPLYFMGTEALQAEREILLKRESDDFAEPRIASVHSELDMLSHNREVEVLLSRNDEDLYLQNLAKLREEAAWLKGIALDTSGLKLVRLDQPAQQPLAPIRPKKLMILTLGLILGAMVGVFVALVRTLMVRKSFSPPGL